MADEIDQQQALPGVTPGPASPATPAYSSEDVETWRAAAERFNALSAQLGPYSDDIQKLVENEEYRTFSRQSWQAFEDAKLRAKPVLTPEAQAIANELAPVKEYVSELRAREKTYNETQQNEYVSKQQSYARKLMADEGVDSDFIEGLAAIAIQKKTDLEGAWGFLNSKVGISRKSAETPPPTSLRGEAATPGVPGRSAEKPPENDVEFRAMLRKRAARAMKEMSG